MYNQEIKEHFIGTYKDKDTQKTIKPIFKKTSLKEEALGKDLFQFTQDEAIPLLTYLSRNTTNGLNNNLSYIRQYVRWCEKQGYSKGNMTFESIHKKDLVGLINFDIANNQYIRDRDTLYSLCSKLKNPVDQALLVLLYEGLLGNEMDEVRFLLKSDIKTTSREISISSKPPRIISNVDKRSIDILEKAINKNELDTRNGTSEARAKKRYMINSPYVIRPTKMHNSDNEPISAAGINIRFRGIRQWVNMYLNATSVFNSGLFERLVKLERDDHKLTYIDYGNVLKSVGMNPVSYSDLKDKYEYFKEHYNPSYNLTDDILGTSSLRVKNASEVASLNHYSNVNEDTSNDKHPDNDDPDKGYRLEKHQHLVKKFAYYLEGIGYSFYEFPMDLLAIGTDLTPILCEVKTLSGSSLDEVAQVRRCLSQLLYYYMFDVGNKKVFEPIQKFALFDREIMEKHKKYLQYFGCLVLWYDEESLKGTSEAIDYLYAKLRSK